jgi:hypothetical protein
LFYILCSNCVAVAGFADASIRKSSRAHPEMNGFNLLDDKLPLLEVMNGEFARKTEPSTFSEEPIY